MMIAQAGFWAPVRSPRRKTSSVARTQSDEEEGDRSDDQDPHEHELTVQDSAATESSEP